MRTFYTLGIYFYTLGIRLAALFGHRNARLMVRGWRVESGEWGVESGEWVWFHAASLGEFEQARPVLEAYRQRHPDHKVLLTFFSPSGYEVRNNYPLADRVAYLPMDTPRNARRLLDAYRPVAAFFVKYEFWYNYLHALRRRQIPTYLFSAIFRPEQYFFRPYGRWFLKQIRLCYRHIFVQNEASLQLLTRHGINATLAGDTRFDRVHQIAQAAEPDAVVERWLAGHDGPVVVGGSTWPPDEELLAKFKIQDSKLKLILAPHVISEEHLQQVEKLFPDSIRYSQLKQSANQAIKQSQVLIIDNIGLLSKLYRYATVAYIGGGFGVGIHNTLEAVAFGKPVLFGPNYGKFQEAKDLIACGGGFAHSDTATLETHLTPLLGDPQVLQRASEACRQYMAQNLGSTHKILDTIEN